MSATLVHDFKVVGAAVPYAKVDKFQEAAANERTTDAMELDGASAPGVRTRDRDVDLESDPRPKDIPIERVMPDQNPLEFLAGQRAYFTKTEKYGRCGIVQRSCVRLGQNLVTRSVCTHPESPPHSCRVETTSGRWRP